MSQIIDNRYQILNKIGQGSMSAVYRALDVDERFVSFLSTLDIQTRSAQEIMNELLTDVRAFLSDEEESDDMTVVVVKVI